ncbi:MAG: hypothetical protein IJO48_06645 [Clostridia bacterium]|nr:hypothetical protein [Clostridia bacterium]
MSFFEQIGRKISDAGHGVAQKTQNLTEIAKLNSRISEKEKQIDALYLEIGKAYYEKNKTDVNALNYDKISMVNNLTAEIAQCREDIKQIKGVEKCPRCGADVVANSAFCNSCGVQMSHGWKNEQPAAPAVRVCQNCNQPAKEGDLFCNCCGTRLS